MKKIEDLDTGIIIVNKSKKDIWAYFDKDKPPCLPNNKTCVLPDQETDCNSRYKIKGNTDRTKTECSWDNNDSQFYNIKIKENGDSKFIKGNLDSISSNSNNKINKPINDIYNAWYIKFPVGNEIDSNNNTLNNITRWCFDQINDAGNKDKLLPRICSGVGLWITGDPNIIEPKCLGRIEMDINRIGKDKTQKYYCDNTNKCKLIDSNYKNQPAYNDNKCDGKCQTPPPSSCDPTADPPEKCPGNLPCPTSCDGKKSCLCPLPDPEGLNDNYLYQNSYWLNESNVDGYNVVYEVSMLNVDCKGVKEYPVSNKMPCRAPIYNCSNLSIVTGAIADKSTSLKDYTLSCINPSHLTGEFNNILSCGKSISGGNKAHEERRRYHSNLIENFTVNTKDDPSVIDIKYDCHKYWDKGKDESNNEPDNYKSFRKLTDQYMNELRPDEGKGNLCESYVWAFDEQILNPNISKKKCENDEISCFSDNPYKPLRNCWENTEENKFILLIEVFDILSKDDIDKTDPSKSKNGQELKYGFDYCFALNSMNLSLEQKKKSCESFNVEKQKICDWDSNKSSCNPLDCSSQSNIINCESLSYVCTKGEDGSICGPRDPRIVNMCS